MTTRDLTPPDLTTRLAGLTLPNPVLTASGCSAPGRELEQFLDVAALGAVVTRSVTLDARAGAPTPRTVETPSGLLNAIGLPGPGIDGFLSGELPWLAQRKARAVVSIAGSTLAEYGELARRIGHSPGVSAVEVNISVPDTRGGGDQPLYVAADPYHAAKVLTVVRRDVPRGIPVLAKLSPDVTRIVDLARAVAGAGADGVVLVNTALGMDIDPRTLRPTLGAQYGGLSGPALRPLALRCVWQVHDAIPDLPIVGVGGVSNGSDVLAYLAAGASAVQVGTAMLHEPTAPVRILAELAAELQRRESDVETIIGCAHRRDPEEGRA